MLGLVSCSGPECDDPDSPGQVCATTAEEALESWIITREGVWCDESCLDSWEDAMRTRDSYTEEEEEPSALQQTQCWGSGRVICDIGLDVSRSEP